MTNIKDALERIRDFPHGNSPSEQAMSQLARQALASLTASPDREKVAVTRDDLLAILNGYLSVEVRGPNGGWQEIVGAEDAVDAILRLVATIAPDEAATRADERALKALRELTAIVRGECPSLLNEDSGGDGRLSIEIDELLDAAARSQEAGR